MERRIFGIAYGAVASLLFAWSNASIAYYSNFDAGISNHLLSVSGGISSPSQTSALNENPAGLIYNQQRQFLGALATSNSHFNPLAGMASFFAGNGSAGGGLSIQNFNAQGDTANQLTLLRYGLATEIPQLALSVGATGTNVLSKRGVSMGAGATEDWDTDLGILFNPNGPVRVGATAFQVVSGVQAFGVGISADPNPYATFALDGSITPKGHGRVVKPSLAIHMDQFQFSYGYGIRINDDDTTSWIRRGSTFGTGFQLSNALHFQAYYNQLSLYFFGLGYQF